jgi:hypothetical protein
VPFAEDGSWVPDSFYSAGAPAASVGAAPIDSDVNPNNPNQYYVLWGNGRIDAYGGAPPITQNDAAAFDRPDQPIIVAIHITDWATGQGYCLDLQGGFQPLNGATDPTTTIDVPPYRSNIWGAPYFLSRKFGFWTWNPDGSNSGYVVDLWGQIYPFGGMPPAPRLGPRFGSPAVRGWAMYWSGATKKGYMLDASGALWADFSAVTPTPNPYYFRGKDVYRALAMLDANAGKGYALDASGATWPFGGAPQPGAYGPYRAGADVARELMVISASDPIRMRQVWSGGQVFEYVQSTPPSVTAGGQSGSQSPLATTTDTTRPTLSWTYSDPQRDSQSAWELYVYTQTFVTGHSMTDPSAWKASAVVALSGRAPSTRGVDSPVDLPNGTYRMYVRAKDSAGQWSAWSNYGWTQNVPVPTSPSGLTATVNAATYSVTLSATTSGTAAFVRFECSDDGGVTWSLVRGAEQITRQSVTAATDWDIPQGVTRTYRAVAYSVAPRTASVASATATAALTTQHYVLTATANSALGGRVWVQEPVAWSRPVKAGVFETVGDQFPTVVSDGRPKARRGDIHLVSLDATTWSKIEALVMADSVLLYRNPQGKAIYCKVVGDWSDDLLPGAATQQMDSTTLPVVEIAPPILAV